MSPQPFGTFPHSVRRSAHVLQPEPPSVVPPVPELPPCPDPAVPPPVDVWLGVPPSGSGAAENSVPEQAAAVATRHRTPNRNARTHLIPRTPKIQGYHEFARLSGTGVKCEKSKELRAFGHR